MLLNFNKIKIFFLVFFFYVLKKNQEFSKESILKKIKLQQIYFFKNLLKLINNFNKFFYGNFNYRCRIVNFFKNPCLYLPLFELNFFENIFMESKFFKQILNFQKNLLSIKYDIFFKNLRVFRQKFLLTQNLFSQINFKEKFLFHFNLLNLNSNKKEVNSLFKIYQTFFFNFFLKKNNIFINFSRLDGLIYYQLSGGLLGISGKKKRSPLVANMLLKLLIKMALNFVDLNISFYKKNLLTMNFNIIIHNYLTNPIIKSFFYFFKEIKFPINCIFDRISIPHSFPIKKKKLRRV